MPLTVNPYLYCENNPVMRTDLSGLSSKGYRAAKMGDATYLIGTTSATPEETYNCCSGDGGYAFKTVNAEDTQWYWIWSDWRKKKKGYGFINLMEWLETNKQGYSWDKSICNIDYSKIQPDTGCANTTYVHENVICSLLAMCNPKASCQTGPDLPQLEMRNPGGCPDPMGSAQIYDDYEYGRWNDLEAYQELQKLRARVDQIVLHTKGQKAHIYDESGGLFGYLNEMWGPWNSLETSVAKILAPLYPSDNDIMDPKGNYQWSQPCDYWTKDLESKLGKDWQYWNIKPASFTIGNLNFGLHHEWIEVRPKSEYILDTRSIPSFYIDPWLSWGYNSMGEIWWDKILGK